MTPDVPPPDWDDAAADVAALFLRTAPEAPAWEPAVVERARTSPPLPLFRFRRNFAMKMSALTLTAAGVTAAVVWLSPRPAEAKVTWDDVEEAVEEVRFFRFERTVTPLPDGPLADQNFRTTSRVAVRVDRPAYRQETPGGLVTVSGGPEEGMLVTAPATGDVVSRTDGYAETIDPFGFLRGLYDLRGGEPERATLNGRPVLRFVVKTEEPGRAPPGTNIVDDFAATRTAWVDAETLLPVRVEFADEQYGLLIVDHAFEYPAEYDPDLFAAAVPAAVAAEIAALREEYAGFLGRPPEPPRATAGRGFATELRPGEGFGPIRLGQTRRELEAATGVPAFTTGPGEWWFALPARGVTARGTDRDGLLQIYAGRTDHAPYFSGELRAAGGTVVTGNTRDAVEAALGKPTAAGRYAPVKAALGRSAESGTYAPIRIRKGRPTALRGAGEQGVLFYEDDRLAVLLRDDAVVQVQTWSPAADEQVRALLVP